MLSFVAMVAAAIAAGVQWFRPVPAFVAEIVTLPATPPYRMTDLHIRVRPGEDGVWIDLPSCDLTSLHDRFFLHTGPRGDAQTTVLSDNRDFPPALEHIRRPWSAQGEQCSLFRSFGGRRPRVMELGQFAEPDGQCCTRLLLRRYELGR